MHNIKKTKTICYKLNALGNIIHSIFNYKFKKPASILRLSKVKNKQAKTTIWKKNWARNASKSLKNELFTKNFLLLYDF